MSTQTAVSYNFMLSSSSYVTFVWKENVGDSHKDDETRGFWLSFHPWSYNYIWIDSLNEIENLAVWLLYIGQLRKHLHQNGSERLRHIKPTSTPTTHTYTLYSYNHEVTSNSKLFPEEQSVWTTYLVPQL